MMKKSDFEGLMRGLKEARAFAKGKPVPGTRVHVPPEIDVAAIRSRTGLSQAAFSRQIGVSVATLRNWEQHRRKPEGPALVLLALLKRDPKIVENMLGRAA
jgi:putative transcriptional regulator